MSWLIPPWQPNQLFQLRRAKCFSYSNGLRPSFAQPSFPVGVELVLVWHLASSGHIVITQGDQQIDPNDAYRGPVRLRRGPAYR